MRATQLYTDKLGQHIRNRCNTNYQTLHLNEIIITYAKQNNTELYIQGASKVLGLRKNYITFTPGNGFKPNFQHH